MNWFERSAFFGVLLVLTGCGGSKNQSVRKESASESPYPNWTAKFLGTEPKSQNKTPLSNPAKLFADPIYSTSASPLVPPTPTPLSQFNLRIDAPPTIAPGQDLMVRIIARNDGSSATPLLSIRHQIPDSVQLLRSEPAASLKGSQLVWDIPQIMPGDSKSVMVVFRPAKSGAIPLRSEAWGNGKQLGSTQVEVLSNSASASMSPSVSPAVSPVVMPVQLAVRVNGPTTARLGETVKYGVVITNSATTSVDRVMLAAELGPGLQHDSGSRRLEIPIPSLAAGDSKTIELPLDVRDVGRLHLSVSAQAQNSGAIREERWLEVSSPQLEIAIAGSNQLTLGQVGSWSIKVTNPGPTPAENVVVLVQLPEELNFKSAERGQLDRGRVVWSIGRLEPREVRGVQLSAEGKRMIDRSTLMASATANGSSEVRNETTFGVLGTPMLKMTVRASEPAVDVGGRVIYTIEIRNPGSLALRDVDVTANLTQQLRPAFGSGPTVVRIDGSRVACGRLSVIPPGQAVAYQFEAEAVSPGDGRVEVEARSAVFGQPVIQQEATRVGGK